MFNEYLTDDFEVYICLKNISFFFVYYTLHKRTES